MKATEPELIAARRLAEATLEYAIAREEGRAARQRERQRTERPAGIYPKATRGGASASPPAPVPALLTLKQAAAAMSISERLLWSMSAPRGPFPVVRIGTAVRYPASELEAALRGMIVSKKR